MAFSDSEVDIELKINPLRAAMDAAYRRDETQCVEHLLKQISFDKSAKNRIENTARQLVKEVRNRRIGRGGLDAFMYEYDLSSEEGIALMCLAEALLRIPDSGTIDDLISDKISPANWESHLGKSDSMLVNAATWGLMLTGKLLSTDEAVSGVGHALKKLLKRSGEPVIRQSVAQAMKILGKQFVMGRTIEEAMHRARTHEAQGYRYSYDMLGEAARTAEDAGRYFKAYQHAIEMIGKMAQTTGIIAGPGISVKLSALHPRYEFTQRDRVLREVTSRLRALALAAKTANIGLTVDAEEADRLDLSLDVIEAVFGDPMLAGWEGFGIAVQSYQKRAWYLLDWLADLSRKHKRRLMVRLIKGAYWDSEIKTSQVQGLEGYPVFTRKASTDVSFLACARKILSMPDAFYPQFATHNAHSVAAILEMVDNRRDFEFQCLHGMGQTLYDQVVAKGHWNIPCRIYAPVGGHEDLLAYLVRRLLENGANTSFVNRIIDEQAPIEEIVADPIEQVRALVSKPHPHIPLPRDLYGKERKNSQGLDLSNASQWYELSFALENAAHQLRHAAPMIAGKEVIGNAQPVYSPNDKHHQVGTVTIASAEQTDSAIAAAAAASVDWDRTPVEERAAMLERAADLFEKNRTELMALIIREGGRTISDAMSEVREAVDFCRYYAVQGRKDFSVHTLPGPTGETNSLQLYGRGIIACISPWNFPLAIFTGQMTAALVTGNCVIAKPAKQTPLVAAAAVKLLHEAGIPGAVLQLLPGSGAVIGARLLADERVKGVVLTGSTETARTIHQTLAARTGAIIPLIAETGGQNTMIVDSSALPEQVVADVLASSFTSAGQRCSALRVLFVQQDIAPKLLHMLTGAIAELRVGNSALLTTDVGPVIDEDAKTALEVHAQRMQKEGSLLYATRLPADLPNGSYFAPRVYEIDSIKRLDHEVFGPILHVVRYQANHLDSVLQDINDTGYGLTLGIHSRIDKNVRHIQQRLRIGNIYVNRNMIGAVVGVQPFGGEGLSGTGPKAGGPYYLHRLCTERTLCINTTAAGGNATLMSLREEDT